MPPSISIFLKLKRGLDIKKAAKELEELFKSTELPKTEPRLNVGWAPALKVRVSHASNDGPLTLFTVPYPLQWAVSLGASPFTFYTNIGDQPIGMMRDRLYWNVYDQTLNKPMVQVGEAVGKGKNATRNLIMEEAMSAGADGLILDGIKDNKASNARIVLSLTPENVLYVSTTEARRGVPQMVGPRRTYIGKQHGTSTPYDERVRTWLDSKLFDASKTVRAGQFIPPGVPIGIATEDVYRLGSNVPHTKTDGLDLMKEYASGLTEILPLFGNTLTYDRRGKILPNLYVANYRRTLQNMGYDPTSLTDEELAKIITDLYKLLTTSLTGKAKGLVFWRGIPSWQEEMEWRNTGQASGNTGAVGPANYFSTYASHYGYLYKDPVGTVIGDAEPFLITDVKGVVPDDYPRKGSGSLPLISGSYTRFGDWVTGEEAPTRDVRSVNEAIAKKEPYDRNTIVVDHKIPSHRGMYSSNGASDTPIGINLGEFGIRRNTGIKSLFAHPETFLKAEDGTIKVKRSWTDPRINRAVIGGAATLTAAEALDLFPDDPVIKHMYATEN